jgi:hypothetical protein
MKVLRWNSKEWFHKLYLYFYARYTGSQENQVKDFHKMMALLNKKYGEDIPQKVRDEFCKGSKPLMPWTNIINFDTRVAVLFLSIGFNIPWMYFLFEITVLEVVRYYVTKKHERLCRSILSTEQ